MDVQLATIEALALAIEAKAGCTPEHIRSIQQYAVTLAEGIGMSDKEVQAVRTAALLHDVGNMAVPEHILAKPEALTPEEFERVKIHPRVGAEILRNVPFGAPVAELVLGHHERWDGLGYPGGLRGKDIPLGARILAIADCYSTLQTDRPYRPARTEARSEEHTSELQSLRHLVCRLLLEKKKSHTQPLNHIKKKQKQQKTTT